MLKRRFFRLTLPLVVLTVTAVGFIRLQAGLTPEWQNTLDSYTSYRQGHGRVPIEVRGLVPATRPWALEPNSHFLVVGDGDFKTDFPLAFDGGGSTIRLPYPPESLYCALLQRGNTLEVVFLAWHSDALYHEAWVVHETVSRRLNSSAVNRLVEVGCHFDGIAPDRSDPARA